MPSGYEYGQGMGSTERIKARDLVVGGRYRHRNGLFTREIEEIEGDRVHYHEQVSSWSCGKIAFVGACPTVATPENEARAAAQLHKLARFTEKGWCSGQSDRFAGPG